MNCEGEAEPSSIIPAKPCPPTLLGTREKRLRQAAENLGMHGQIALRDSKRDKRTTGAEAQLSAHAYAALEGPLFHGGACIKGLSILRLRALLCL